jgi:hypothetical protein
MKWVEKLIVIFTLLLFQGCAPFNALKGNVQEGTKISTSYCNDVDTSTLKIMRGTKLWQHIDRKYSNNEDSLIVRMELLNAQKLKAQLFKSDEMIAEKMIKGQLKSDQCFYKKRVFYVVPIFPLLWWYKNEQIRFYVVDNCLTAECTYNTGGTFIIFAGGNKNSLKWNYKKWPH